MSETYGLATGKEGERRLDLVHDVYGNFCETVISRIQLPLNPKIVDIGCGLGSMTGAFAERARPYGQVTGLDSDQKQLELAKGRLSHHRNIDLVVASAYETGLPSENFDLVHCRLLLVHLARPVDALNEMLRLLKPGGTLVCFDIDITTIRSLPATDAYDLYRANTLHYMNDIRKLDATIGSRLHILFRNLGLTDLEIDCVYPTFLGGEKKRMWEYTFNEWLPSRLKSGAMDEETAQSLADAMAVVAADQSIAVSQACMFGCWGRKGR